MSIGTRYFAEGTSFANVTKAKGLENMHFCETNRIGHDTIFDATRYTYGSYDCKVRKVNPVRLAGNEQSALSKHGYKGAELRGATEGSEDAIR